ncbi:MAG TPA: undecaprenyl-diphosphate phosphatase [Thermoanaerobaculia bacterium]|nr:undecaprenyl-diphosphate phosphatase [Thermoanaerobaculia bacterium]
MSWAEALLLGVIQGLTEFLPVSSDGHLSAAELLLPRFRQVGILFDVMVHLGTLAAVVVYFRRPLAEDVAGLFSGDPSRRASSWRLAALVVAATVPTGIVGLLLKATVEASKRDPRFVGAMEILTGVFLTLSLFGRKTGRDREQTTLWDALLIGTVQGLAVLPGLSRSATTIAFALLVGLAARWSASFSFYLLIPAVFGASLLELFSAWKEQGGAFFAGSDFAKYVFGAAVAGVVGYFAIGWLIRAVVARRLYWFAIYCVLFGLALIYLFP